MDSRKALEAGFVLNLRNIENGNIKYTIRNEIGRGASCIVYDAYYSNNIEERRTVRIKECYPVKLKIRRLENGELVTEEKYQEGFQRSLSEIKDAFRRNNQLYNDVQLTNSISNTIDIYEANGTVYIVSTYQSGKILSIDNISSLKDAINIVKSVAEAVKRIHDNGYLYLDIKPSNIFVYSGVTDIVQLFDFDSMIPIRDLKTKSISSFRISYSAGFAALEQKTADIKKLGKHSDVFSVGALLFYLLFGHVPNAFDCQSDAVYDFESGIYQPSQYQDTLFRDLTDFFHHSIASYYADRYSDLLPAIKKLKTISRLSDIELPFIISTTGISPKELVGREHELEQIKESLQNSQCLLVTGMGGIGKSSLVRTFVGLHKKEYDSNIYTYYNGSALDLLTDDSQLIINTVQRTQEETLEDYYLRKSKILQKILYKKNALLIVDNFFGEIDEYFRSILSLGWKVIVISREEIPLKQYPDIKLGAVECREDLHHLFQVYLKRDVSDDEYPFLDKIIDSVKGHSLVLELIAKQIDRSYLTIEQAYLKVRDKGFSEIAPEKIDFEKDSITASDTIRNIISRLFPSENFGIEKKKILKALSLFDAPGVKIPVFLEMLSLNSYDDINDLITDRWIETDGNRIALHSVIKEVVNTWEWEQYYKEAAFAIIKYLFKCLKLEGKREEYPADLLRYFRKIKDYRNDLDNSPYPWSKAYSRWFQHYNNSLKKKSFIGEIYVERLERGGDEYTSDHELVTQLLSMSEKVLSVCSKIRELANSDEYKNLLYQTIINVPEDREQYILDSSLYLLNNLGTSNDDIRYDLYDRIVTIHTARHDYNNAWLFIQRAGRGITFKNSYIKGLYYSILAEFYDGRLAGAYAVDNEYHDRDSLLDALDNSIKHFKRKSKYLNRRYKLTQSYISKAITLCRCYPEKIDEIDHVIQEAKSLCEKYAQSNSSLVRDYSMCCAWYFTYVHPYGKGCADNIRTALEINKRISTSDMETIDGVIIPFANMNMELGLASESASMLKSAITLCEQGVHAEVIPYIRKKLELYSYLLEVYYLSADTENGKETINMIEEMNRQYCDDGIGYDVPDEIRSFFCS